MPTNDKDWDTIKINSNYQNPSASRPNGGFSLLQIAWGFYTCKNLRADRSLGTEKLNTQENKKRKKGEENKNMEFQ